MKKSKIKKLLAKEMAQYESRITHIEREIAPKLDAPASIQPHFDEVTEGLPEKWVVAITDGNKPKLEKWYQESHCKENLMSGYYVSNSYFIWTGVPSDYTEITFETFKKYVLKEEVKKAVEFEKGKWYKDDVRKRLFCFSGEYDWDGDPTGYGFVYQMWYNNKIGWKGVKTPATETEVFEALKAEACKQYKVGQTVFDNWSNCKITLNDLTRFDYSNGNLFVLNLNNSKTHLLGSDGQWATIIPQPEAIDFSKAGQYFRFQGIGNNTIVMSLEGKPYSKKSFCGIVIQSDDKSYPVTEKRDDWDKKTFTLCTEPVTLKNE